MAETEADRQKREHEMIIRAEQQNKLITYIDSDGCEVTVTPGGHSFYNVADWW